MKGRRRGGEEREREEKGKEKRERKGRRRGGAHYIIYITELFLLRRTPLHKMNSDSSISAHFYKQI